MTVNLSDEIARVWPTTEATLLDAADVGYSARKLLAIERAKRALYVTETVPTDEDDIPDIAKYWIADQATVYLIPLAKDYYMSKQRLSDSKEGATISYYDKVQALDKLRAELEASLSAGRADALTAIDSSVAEDEVDDTPAVSIAGMMVDPAVRAYNRGYPGGGWTNTTWTA